MKHSIWNLEKNMYFLFHDVCESILGYYLHWNQIEYNEEIFRDMQMGFFFRSSMDWSGVLERVINYFARNFVIFQVILWRWPKFQVGKRLNIIFSKAIKYYNRYSLTGYTIVHFPLWSFPYVGWTHATSAAAANAVIIWEWSEWEVHYSASR